MASPDQRHRANEDAGEDSTDRLIVVGASAGGIEALSTLVRSLTDPFPAPIVVAQHLDPRRPSHLGDILSRQTSLPVRTILEPTKLQPGVIYLVPSDRHVEITDHEVTIRPAADTGPKPSVDRLLKSAARSFGEGCVAVILTGSGSDGTAGAQAVKEAGGTVIIQNPATASFPSMPRSLAPSTVDIVTEIGEMGDILRRIVTAEPLPAGDEDAEVTRLLDRLRSTNGIDFSRYKRPTILRRLRGRMHATQQSNVRQYARYIDMDPAEHQRLVSSFLIKVTSFFRDPKVMTYLRDTVMPDLVESALRTGQLRLWSAGCATGEEAYSLAIMVAEGLGARLGEVEVRIFATDVDDEALAFARRGVYARSALTNLSAAQRRTHFDEVDGEWEVVKRIRSMVTFGQHDLGVRAPFPRMDLILCRNVLIYFTREMQERALSVFAYSLRTGGRLILGSSETVGPFADAFDVEDQRLKVYRSRGDAHVVGDGPYLRPRAPARKVPTSLDRSVTVTRVERDRRRGSVEHAERVFNELPIGVAVVDGKYVTLRINRVARELLEIHGPALGQDLIHLTETLPTTELRAAIRSAFAGRTSEGVYRLAGLDHVDEDRYVRLNVSPHRAVEAGQIEGAVLVIVDVTTAEADRIAVDALTVKLHRSNEQRVRLAEANREMAAANDELRLANEDFLFNAEEAQASREEMETLAEELQATNEELETLNEELQATNEELETSNDELAVRTDELAIQQTDLAQERDRLASVIDGMTDALMVVDRDGRIAITNQVYNDLFGGPDSTFAPEDDTGTALPRDRWPQARAHEGAAFRMEFTFAPDGGVDDIGRARRWFEATGGGLRSADERWAGVVVIREITDRSMRVLEEQFMAAASHELRTPLAALHAYVQLIVRRLEASDGDGKVGEYAASALAQTRNLNVLVDRLFDVSRVATGRFELDRSVVDLVALARRVADVAGTLDPDPPITVNAANRRVEVEVDPGRIEQVLLGLLTNSLVHGAATRVTVNVRRVGRAHAELNVSDDGRGIPMADQPALFDRLARVSAGHRTSRPGLGLGLFLARQIVRAHDGSIELVSVEGRGTTVTVRLPRIVVPRRR